MLLANGIHNEKNKPIFKSLKSANNKNMKSHVVYETKCSGSAFIYVGQTSRHATTRLSKNQEK